MEMEVDAQTIHSFQSIDPVLVFPDNLGEKSAVGPFLVRFAPGDPENPKNWSNLKRWYLTLVSGLLIFSSTFASSVAQPAIPELAQEFGFSDEVGALTISLFVFGYCVGPLLWGPLSEQYGRRPIFILSFVGFMAFQIGCALAKNTGSILAFRFLGGAFSAAPLSNSGALISDIWGPRERGSALAVFIVAPFAGPGIGPLVGGYMYDAGVSWRWVFWMLTIFSGACLLQIILSVPETFEPIILVRMARGRRKITGDTRYYAAMERNSTKFAARLEAILARPFKVLFQEPMLFMMTIYMSFVYGCIYLLLEAYPVVYTTGHHLSPGPAGLVFLPIAIGSALGGIAYALFVNRIYIKKVEEYAPEPVPPEYRLRPVMVTAPLFAASFFWFAWTSFPSVSLWVPMTSALVTSFCMCWIFLGLITYIVDVYLSVSATALAAAVVVRSTFGGGFPLFGSQMYTSLGVEWASTVIGFVALALMPIPFVLSRYGPAIRAKSKFAPPQPSFKLSV